MYNNVKKVTKCNNINNLVVIKNNRYKTYSVSYREKSMGLKSLLNKFKSMHNNNRDKGTSFEKIIKEYLLIDPKYASFIEEAWLWSEFPYRDNKGDTGIDIVAKTHNGEFWAIQCKFYDENYAIQKADVDTFLATSSKYFFIDGKKTLYSYRLIVSTTNKYSKNAEDALKDQNPEVGRIGITDLLDSSIDWEQFINDDIIKLKVKYKPKEHQRNAIDDVLEGFKTYDRGKLIMACGTGKTFTSLRIVEELLNGKGNVLFLVPSISLISQTISEWSAQCNYTFDALVVCSDSKVSKGENLVDLGIPSTTNVDRLCEWANKIKNDSREMHFIFSTYQSIDAVSKFQDRAKFDFDIIVCDEAHRTTGVTLSDEDESYFVKVHDNKFISARKRLYMTATPRIFSDNVKKKANDVNAELCSMDDESKYGKTFHNLTFSDAVAQSLLTDYKVLVLAVDEEYVKRELQYLLTDENHELKLDDTVKIMGCWNGLSKKSIDKNNYSFNIDPAPMKRSVAFCNRIKDSEKLVEMFKVIQNHIKDNNPEEYKRLVNIEIEHVDGKFNALEKKDKINWLKEDTQYGTCRILTNARCLSEGIDVPALDSVIFLNPRSSMVDIIQSVGRVMRKSPGKKYGYVMLPIGIPSGENPEEALDNNEKYKIVWSVLQALRAHDDRFNNIINKIELNRKKPKQIDFIGIGNRNKEDKDKGTNEKNTKQVQLSFNLDTLEQWRNSIYAKMVKKVGSRVYWEMWAKDVAQIAKTHSERINILLSKNDPEVNTTFHEFVEGLKQNLNNSITEKDAIEMLSEHMITKPVFDALFEGYEFVKSNPVSQVMQKMMDILDRQALDEEKSTLQRFYKSVRERAADIDNSLGKQKIILELYEKFFKVALPKEVEKLGIVYTPSECVDFIIQSVESLLQSEFNKSLSDKGVHIIDGFTGTGTFIVRLLQSGIIKKEDILYKYTNEIHANEIILLAYYIATINIEETFHDIIGKKEYIPFEGVVLTDTFQLYEDWKENEFTKAVFEEVLPVNSERAKKQRNLPITVCIGNPPYSIGQKSANDNAQNLSYPKLDKSIAETYAKNSKANLKRGLYDQYIRAFRWASDRIESNGIIGFITNGAFIDNQGMDGFRKCLIDEFNTIYIFNLRGNQRTSGEESRKEGGKIFGSGSRNGIAITILIKKEGVSKDGYIHYSNIGDYLTREKKLEMIKDYHDVTKMEWKKIYLDENNDWINKRNNDFNNFIAIFPEKKGDLSSKSFFTNYAINPLSTRDAWVYNFSTSTLNEVINLTLKTYNEIAATNTEKVFIEDKRKISWSAGLKKKATNGNKINFNKKDFRVSQYRPYCKEYVYYNNDLFERPGKINTFLNSENVYLCVSGIGGSKPFSCLITNAIPDIQTLFNSQCFPMYWYEQIDDKELFDINDSQKTVRRNGISDFILEKCKNKYGVSSITREDIFYYVYGILHSTDYREKFEFDLKKSLPKIPLVKTFEDFKSFCKAGRKLANLHLNYEKIKPYDGVVIELYKEDYSVAKMTFKKINKKIDKSCIIFNKYISISNIPIKAYQYVINGKSAIEWVMEKYMVTVDKNSGIVNDANDWCKEINDPQYILNLLLRVINVSIQTVDIVKSLPKINFD